MDELFAQLNMELEHLTPAKQQMLKSLITSYAAVFALNSSELGMTDVVTHSIDTGETQDNK